MVSKKDREAVVNWAVNEIVEIIFRRSQENLTEPFGEDDYIITDTGLLLESGKIVKEGNQIRITYSADYASDVEYGADPRVVDIKDLRKWVRRKLGMTNQRAQRAIARNIQNKIATYGTSERPYLRNARDLGIQEFLQKYSGKTIRLK